MDNNNYASQILEENSEQNQKELNSNESENSENNNNNNMEEKIDFSINENPELNQNNSSSSSYLKKKNSIDYNFSIPTRVKPNFIRLSNQIFNDLSLFQSILNYLNIFELNNIRRINHNLLLIVHEYYKRRIKIEIDFITDYQEKNKDKVYFFMKNIDTQIPLSNNNWLDFDLNSVVNKLNILNRNIINKLRCLKNINKLSDDIYAPFCIIFSKNIKLDKKFSWKKIANQILSNYNLISNIQNLDIENFDDKIILEAFKYLNMDELQINNVKKYSPDISKLIIWCQAVVSYHIIIHPYIYRNKNNRLIQPQSDIFNFILEIENMIEKFYKFKRFLYNLNIMKIPLADYVFNLKHNHININIEEYKNINNIDNIKINYINKFDISIISKILSYIPFNQSYKMIRVCKKFYEGFKSSIDLIIFEMIKEIYFFRYQSYKRIINDIPLIFSHNFFSKFFLMIDDILNSNTKSNNEFGMSFYPFLSNDHLNNLKIIKIKNDLIEQISKIFCNICDLKPLKKKEFQYFDIIKNLVIKGELIKIMRNFNKLFFNGKKIWEIYEELKVYMSNQKLNEVKRINKGIYQLLIWELFILLYLKLYNVFDFITFDNVQKNYNKQQLERIHYYIELMNYLKYYLNIKFHFSGGNRLNTNINKNFEFYKYFKELTTFLQKNNLSKNSYIILESTNEKWEKIGNAYFESKDSIPFKVKPTFYERIMIEILNLNENNESNSIYSISRDSKNTNNEYNLNINNTKKKDVKRGSIFELRINMNNRININKFNYNKNNNYINPVENKFKITNKNNLKKLVLDSIPEDIFITNIFFYLDIGSLPIIGLINHKYLSLVKTHYFIRLYYLKKEKKCIEDQNKEIFNLIKDKRKSFFKQYEIKPPSKEHSLNLINQMKEKDFLELRQYFKTYNKNYEKIIIPFLLLLGEKPTSSIGSDGMKIISFYPIAKKVLFNPNFIKRIKEIELELIPYSIFKIVEKAMKDKFFSEKKIQNINSCFNKLINWIFGVLEFHKAIRKYTLSDYDYDILNKDEINFCIKMDNIILLYYKLNRYITKYCKDYENKSKMLMKKMGIIN